MTPKQLQTLLYKAQRAVGDARALDRGPDVYAKRVARRMVTRSIFRFFGNFR